MSKKPEEGKSKLPEALQAYFQNKERYDFNKKLGQGGMAEVLEYDDHYFHRSIAFKSPMEDRNKPRHIKEFLREAKVMGKLEHPGVVPIFQLLKNEKGRPGITMRKIDGQSLAVMIHKAKKEGKRWPVSECLRIFEKLAEVIDYAHSRGVLHRDIKPSNVMIGHNGEVTLIDWGLAKFQAQVDRNSGRHDITEQFALNKKSARGAIKGTPYYMSPEAARGQGEEINERSDIFSLGAILFELVTFERLIPGDNAEEALDNSANAKLKYGLLKKHKVRGDLVHVIKKCTQPIVDKRYPIAEALRKDVFALRNDQPVTGYRYSPFYKIYRWIKNNWGFSFCMLIVIVASLIALSLPLHIFLKKQGQVNELRTYIRQQGLDEKIDEAKKEEEWLMKKLRRLQMME